MRAPPAGIVCSLRRAPPGATARAPSERSVCALTAGLTAGLTADLTSDLTAGLTAGLAVAWPAALARARLRAAVVALLCTAPWLAQAQPAAPDSRTTVGVQAERTLQARQQAASCAACHGPDGHAPAGSPIPGLAGKPQAQMVEQMLAFKNGQRAGTVMPQLARGYSDAEIVAIAAWFADRGGNGGDNPRGIDASDHGQPRR
ncbi:c-type cytochrome [Cupriavidus plantarum]|uniref:c-type cytochrome n=1 Tax=Cupriavidus plantarum TaxID=942865 RepID=UPI000E264B3C|nr:cytochrome c553 [Cupriavidus plantarum]REE86332.1 cytochrome c553 [Cupriavidus plantarum]